MSNISNRHAVSPFVAGKSEALSGQRLAKVGFKLTEKMKKEGKSVLPSVFASVPVIDVQESITDWTPWFPHIRVLMENAQDGIFRAAYEQSGGTLQAVTDDMISPAAILAYLDAETAGGRLTVEVASSWFDAQVADNLYTLIAEKLGYAGQDALTEDQDTTVKQHLAGYRGLMGKLAGGKTILNEKQLHGLGVALDIASVEDDICTKLRAKIAAMKQPQKVEELLEL